MRIGQFGIFKEKAGVISRDPIWVIFYSCYMYTADTLLGVLWLFITEFKHERHMIG